MIFGVVAGTVVSTVKSDTTEGTRYMLVQVCDYTCRRKNRYVVALDLVGSGVDEMVLIAQGSSSRQTPRTYEKPIDTVIVGIVDLIEESGKVVYRKGA
ncbi:MAG: EutN/CcmL family microcompartment protein [Spirochaetota bacterium]